jgi:hypothetical protein
VLPFDVGFNVLAYIPLGMLTVFALQPRVRGLLGIALTVLCGALLSGALESLQNLMPTRTPSLADLAANSFGALLGALIGAMFVPALFDRGALNGMRERWFVSVPGASQGVVLTLLWLFALLFPHSMLFSVGFVIDWFMVLPGYPFTPEQFGRVEQAVTASSLFACGSLLLSALSDSAPRLRLLIAFMLLACVARALSQAVLFSPDQPFAWATEGALRGLGLGMLALLITISLPRAMRLALVAITTTFTIVVVNLAPANPYYTHIVQELNPGRYLNFNGLTEAVASLWPFLVLLHVVYALARSAR